MSSDRRPPRAHLPLGPLVPLIASALVLAGCAAGGATADGSAGASATAASPATVEAPTTLIRGARLIDGTGAAARGADVRIRGDRIAEVGRLDARPGERVVDAAGLALAPGFIDTHSHHSGALLRLPDAAGAVSQGITTIVAGQDGGSWHPLSEYFRRVEETGVAVNVASYVGHGTIREEVMGEDFRRAATADEVAAMTRLLRRDMDAGALGLSTGLEYDPGIYSTTGEVVTLARAAGERGGRYISHMRSEDRALFDAIRETIVIGQQAAIPVQVSHMKLAMKSLWGRADELIALLDSARAAGVDITADVYPYTYWQSTMTVLFPERRFDDREAATFALDELAPPEGMLIARYAAEPRYEGRTLADVAGERGEDPVTAYMALIARSQAEDADESIIATSMDEGDVARLLQWPHTNVSSDGGLDGAHPRGFGAFTRVLGPMVREGHLSLEEAVHKMTALSAAHTGIEGRGVIRPGAFADLVLFDPATVADRATPESPHARSVGIHQVWVNGAVVYENGGTTGARPGRVVRRGDGADGARASIAASARTAGPDRAGAVPPLALDTAGMDSVFRAYDSSRAPGCAVGVMRAGELAFGRGYGMADLDHGIALDPASVFRIGSVSKQFTAAAIALLAQEGAISLDDPVRRHIPELPDFGPRFTIRSLLHHTSGARDYLTLMSLAGKRDADWYTDDDVVAMLRRQTAPNFEPGSEHLYSNSGYFLLSQIVKRVTGLTLAEYARDRMFEPMGMRRTHFHDDPTVIVPDRAMGYAPADDGGYRISMTTLPMIGDGGVFTSIEELAAWDRNLDAGSLVGGAAFVDAMHDRVALTGGDTISYALGLVHGRHRGLRTVSHGGAFVGYRAASLRYPDEAVSIYTLCNRADADPSGLNLEVGGVVLGARMEPAVEGPAAGRPERERVDTLSLAVEELRAYEGAYHAEELDAVYRITLDSGALQLHVGNWLDGGMAPIGEDVFRRGPLTLRFEREAGRIAGFVLDAGRVRGIRFSRSKN